MLQFANKKRGESSEALFRKPKTYKQLAKDRSAGTKQFRPYEMAEEY